MLVVGADVALQLLGITADELKSPIQTLQRGDIRGLRLIPYRAVGQPNGMLLATRLDCVLIDGKKTGNLVAFAPQVFDAGEYQALAGGVL